MVAKRDERSVVRTPVEQAQAGDRNTPQKAAAGAHFHPRRLKQETEHRTRM